MNFKTEKSKNFLKVKVMLLCSTDFHLSPLEQSRQIMNINCITCWVPQKKNFFRKYNELGYFYYFGIDVKQKAIEIDGNGK